MSIDMLKAVKDAKFGSSGRKYVMQCLADYADENGACWPSVALISIYTEQGEKTVRNHLKNLTELGVIKRQRQRREDGTLGRYRFYIQTQNFGTSGQNSQLADLGKTSGQKGQKPVAKSAAHCNQLTTNELPLEAKPKVSTKNRGSRLSDDWWITDDLVTFGVTEGLNIKQIEREADKFKDYWQAKSGVSATKVDWNKTFKNWIRSHVDRNSQNQNSKPMSVQERAIRSAMNA